MITPNDQVGGLGGITVTICEEERQAIILALARLSVERPGWLFMLEELSKKFGDGNAVNMFNEFRKFAGPPPGFSKEAGNQFEVVRSGDKIVVLNLSPMSGRHVFSIREAIEFAAWLQVLADPVGTEFERVRREIRK
jgi:hypothetical protein